MTQTATVFLSSRFQEFSTLRRAIKQHLGNLRHTDVEVINLDDGQATHKPPLAECLKKVDESDTLVLLIGDTYGTPAPGHQYSFTHMEYRRALERRKQILVFACGKLYDPIKPLYREGADVPTPLRNWLEELQNHTIRVLDIDDGPELMAVQIGSNVQDAFQELKGFEVERTAAGLPHAIQVAFDDDEGDSERFKVGVLKRVNIVIQDSEIMSRKITERSPAAAQAREALIDAQEALDNAEFEAAFRLLERAKSAKPMDPDINYLLAKYYLNLGNRFELQGAAESAKLAYKIYLKKQKINEAGLAALLLARINRRLNAIHEALNAVMDVSQLFKRDAEILLEVARYQILADQGDQAVETLTKEIYRRRPDLLAKTFSDSDFKSVRIPVQAFLEDEDQRIRISAKQTFRARQEVGSYLGFKEGLMEPPPDCSVSELRRLARFATEVQRQLIGEGLDYLTKEHNGSPEDRLKSAEQVMQYAQRQYDLSLIDRLSKEALVRHAQSTKIDEQQLQHLSAQVEEARLQEAYAELQLSTAADNKDEVQRLDALNPEQLGQAVECFYKKTLRKATLIPYPTVFSASPGKIIRADQNQLDQFERDRDEKGLLRTIEIVRPSQEWWPKPGKTDKSIELFRVIDMTSDKLILSVLKAYSESAS